jgi:broad specificity phosphatase PhoE
VTVYLVRHGRATAGWDTDPDPGLDVLGREQAASLADRLGPLGPMPIVASPLRRCRETAAPLAARWGVEPRVDEAVAEIPSPLGVPMGERVAWLQAAMAGTWAELGDRYTAFRDGAVQRVATCATDTVFVSHFVAINAVIGACTGDDRLLIHHLDNTSVTVVDVAGGELTLVQAGEEDPRTLIR